MMYILKWKSFYFQLYGYINNRFFNGQNFKRLKFKYARTKQKTGFFKIINSLTNGMTSEKCIKSTEIYICY